MLRAAVEDAMAVCAVEVDASRKSLRNLFKCKTAYGKRKEPSLNDSVGK